MQTLENRTYDELAIGERASLSHQVEERDLLLFAAVPLSRAGKEAAPPRRAGAGGGRCLPPTAKGVFRCCAFFLSRREWSPVVGSTY